MKELEVYKTRWGLTADGPSISTQTGTIYFVRHGGQAMVLKLSTDPEEQQGGAIMAWWDGSGAASVLAHDGPALLMERAEGGRSLSVMAREGEDDAATRILCSVAGKLHAIRKAPPEGLIPLERRFRALDPAAQSHGGIFDACLGAARHLLASPQEVTVLHGDLHHDNVLDFGSRGWLAIDPKGIWGERGFDFANIFLNPDLARPGVAIAINHRVFCRRVTLVAEAAALPRERLLRWILAWSGLSMAWSLQDGRPAPVNLQVAEMAAAALNG